MEFCLHYEEKGEGEPLVLLHGNGEDGRYFSSQIQFFSSRYRVIAVDTRGHGRSPRGEGALTLSVCADDLKSLLQRLGLDRINLLGFRRGKHRSALCPALSAMRAQADFKWGQSIAPGG